MDKITHTEPTPATAEEMENIQFWQDAYREEVAKTLALQLSHLGELPELEHAVIQPRSYPL